MGKSQKWEGMVDFSMYFDDNQRGVLLMKNICKSLMALLVTSSAFVIGFYLGKEKIIAKIPQFQADSEEHH